MVGSPKQVYRLTVRATMHSPGVLPLGNEIERRFSKEIATGLASEKAAEA
ncbi:hypothetical protein J2793_007265 [Paraburkholderia caledonica]|uniref:Uncharacterized protein n=1 Tax=Paraburkholderia caledonica TaxID=134536 RepID=A0AB73IP39_9BURK|nr:hypothetical protein [Paraburkholderia caledonica]